MTLDLYTTSAFFLGAVHALEPGHGKIILMTYLIGIERKLRNAFVLAAIATFTHTFSILILGVAAGVSTKYVIPHDLEHGMEKVAGWFVLSMGLWMIYSLYKKKECRHSHAVAESNTKNFKQLMLLGMSGGAIPCPAALAVLSASVAAGQAANGILFILYYGLGLGATLLVTGIFLIKASGYMNNFLQSRSFEHNARKISALLITCLGIWFLLK